MGDKAERPEKGGKGGGKGDGRVEGRGDPAFAGPSQPPACEASASPSSFVVM